MRQNKFSKPLTLNSFLFLFVNKNIKRYNFSVLYEFSSTYVSKYRKKKKTETANEVFFYIEAFIALHFLFKKCFSKKYTLSVRTFAETIK